MNHDLPSSHTVLWPGNFLSNNRVLEEGHLSLAFERRDEIEALAQHYGTPFQTSAAAGSRALWQKRGRHAEVCMVIRRKSGRFLTFRKTFYPPGLFRLPTGGVEAGEPIVDALWREIAEETSLEVQIDRMLSVVWFHATDQTNGEPVSVSVAFLLSEVGGELMTVDSEEQVEEFSETDLSRLKLMSKQLETLPANHSPEFEERWRDWGLYRASVHRPVIEALNTEEPQAPNNQCRTDEIGEDP